MNVSLTPELENLLPEKVQSGLYNPASEVVREALRLVNDRDIFQQQRLAKLRREIDVGLDDLEHGGVVRHNKQSLKAVFEKIKQEGRKAL